MIIDWGINLGKWYVEPTAGDTIRQQIIDAVDTRLKTILIANGYKTDAGNNVYHWLEVPGAQEDMPFITYRDAGEVVEDVVVGEQWRTINLEIGAFNKGATVDQGMRSLIADIEQCIGTDLRWSGLAEDTTMVGGAEDIEMEHKDKKLAGILLRFEIEYTAERFNAYQ